MVKKVYRVENLDCANCASKVEAALNALPEVQEAVLTYATMQLRITAEDPDALLPKLQEAAQKVEPEVEFYPKDGAHTHHNHTGEHEHHHDCCCGHEHHHDHDHEHEHCHDHAHDHHHDDDHEHEHEHHHNHEHTHEHSHDNGHEHGGEESEDLKPILVGAVLFVVGLVLDHFGLKWPTLGVCLVAYVLLGREVIVTAVKNLARGQMLDENFLMALASIGAFFTGSFTEAVGVMLFYRVGEYFEDRAVARSRSQIMEAVDLRPEVVQLVDGETVREIPAGEAEIGDIVLVRPGDRIPLDGIVIVTSPQELVGMIVEKAVNMAGLMNIPIFGLIENMSYFTCPDCGKKHSIFGESHIDEIAARHNLEVLGKLPIDPKLAAACDAGKIEECSAQWLAQAAERAFAEK